jgi:hypothetical protein
MSSSAISKGAKAGSRKDEANAAGSRRRLFLLVSRHRKAG